ncbi:MAG: imidazolonepropionase [Bdellovibrionaceae bacterium]|nr:imidazolonepropionase [Pseudobdellovibrionaceae bacterium]
MSFTLFYNISELLSLKEVSEKQGRHITSKDFVITKKAAIISYKGKIVWVGKYAAVKPRLIKQLMQINKITQTLQRHSLSQAFIMPAFVECHTHLLFAGNRASEFNLRQKGMSYSDITKKGGGILSTVKATRKLSLLELKRMAQKRAEVFLSQGVTSLEAKSGYGLNLSSEIKMLEAIKSIKKLNTKATLLALHTLPKEFSSKDKYFQWVINQVLPKAVKKQVVDRVDIFVEQMAFNKKHMTALFKQASDYNLGLTVHSDQLSPQGTSCLASQQGASSVDHVNFVSDSEIKQLSKANVSNVFLPGADFYLKMPYPQARKFLDAGARVALATDYNPGTCPCNNIEFIGLLARLEMNMTIEEVVAAYTVSAAYALGMQNTVGSLQVGKQADFISLNKPYDELFYSSTLKNPVVKSVYRLGRLVASNGQVVVEYALLLMISVILAMTLVNMTVSRNPDSPGFIIKKWGDILKVIGEDTQK